MPTSAVSAGALTLGERARWPHSGIFPAELEFHWHWVRAVCAERQPTGRHSVREVDG